jgi:hypothetical protein
MTRTIAARYAGKCQLCGKEYAAGDSITRIAYRKWVHAGCYTPASCETAAPPAVPPVTPTTSPMPVNEIAAIIHRLLDGAELSVDKSEVRRLVQAELAQSGAVQRFEVKLPNQTIRTVRGKPHAKFAHVLRLAAGRLARTRRRGRRWRGRSPQRSRPQQSQRLKQPMSRRTDLSACRIICDPLFQRA